MPPTIEDKRLLEDAERLLSEQTTLSPQNTEDIAEARLAQISDAQTRIASASAELEAYQDKTFQGLHKATGAVDFATLTPELAAGHGVPFPSQVPEGTKTLDALGRFNQIREKYGLEPAEQVPEKIGILEQAGEELDVENLPLVGGFETARQLWNVQSASKRVEKGEAVLEDWETLAAHMDQAAMDARERTFGGGVARITLGSVPFWLDFFASGGVPAVLKRGGQALAKRQVKKSMAKMFGEAASGLARMAGTTALRMPVFSHRVAAGAFQRATPQFATAIPKDAGDDVEFVVLDEGEGALEATKNALGDVYIEIFSEQTGRVVGLVGGKVRRAIGMKPARVGARDFLANFGIHGVAGEMVEERIGEGLREAAMQLGALDLPQQVPDAEQLAQEAIAFAIPVAGGRVAGRAIRDRPTLERARAFVELHPEESKRIAAIEGKASRSKLKKAAGNTLAPEEIDRMRRSVFRDMIAAAVEEQDVEQQQAAESAETTPPDTQEQELEGPDFRPSYTFKATKAGKQLADEIRQMLPEGLKSKVRVAKGGSKQAKGADGEQVASRVGVERMARSILLKQTGRPDLANPAEGEQGRKLVRASDEIDALSQVPERRRDEVVKMEAQQRLERDYAGERVRMMEVAAVGGRMNDADVAVAKKIVGNESLEAALSGDLDQVRNAIGLIQSYRRTRTETARALRQGFDPVESPAERRKRSITETLLRPSAEVEAQIQRHLDRGETGEAKRLENQWAEQYGEILKDLERVGIDLANIDDIVADDVATVRLNGIIQARKASGFDAVFEYWRNSILSAPTTQMANIIGNTTFAGWHYTAERLVEAMINTVARQPGNVQWGEFKYLAAGVLPGLSKGVKNFYRAWNSEAPFFELSLGKPGSTKIEEPHVAIAGQKGRVIRAPQRMLLAFDELYKSVFGQMEVGAQAYRIAKSEGLRGPQLQERIARLTEDANSPAWDAALAMARKLTFQSRESKALGALLEMRRSVPGMRYILPFATTPWNIFGEGIKRSPLGALNLAAEAYRAHKTGSWKKVVSQSANQLIAWSAVLWLMDNDPDEPWITGAASAAKYNTRTQAYRTFPPQSVKIGDAWYSYARVEPLATWLSLAVDVAGALNSDRKMEAFVEPFNNLAGQIQNKTFMQGIGDIAEMFDRGFDFDALARWASSFVVSWVPNLVRSMGDNRSEFVPERGVWAEGEEKLARWTRRVFQRTGMLGTVTDEPKVDLWGRRAQRGLERRPQSDFWWRVLLPIRRHTEDIATGDRIIMNWNSQHPDDLHHPVQPRPYRTLGGEKRWMSDRQYTQFLELSGKRADRMVDGNTDWNVEQPTEKDIQRIGTMLERARSSAFRSLRTHWLKNPATERDPALVSRLLEQAAGDTEVP
jgi:hypothetical protein